MPLKSLRVISPTGFDMEDINGVTDLGVKYTTLVGIEGKFKGSGPGLEKSVLLDNRTFIL